jgi:hypothetical protein
MRLYSFLGTVTILLLLGAAALVAAPADSRLADAAMRGDREALGSLLTDRSSINVSQIDGTTALHWAVRKGDLETADAERFVEKHTIETPSRRKHSGRPQTVGRSRANAIVHCLLCCSPAAFAATNLPS